MSNKYKGQWDERLQCDVLTLDYDFHTHAGKLHLVDGHCCDMTGCIKLFQSIDPQVIKILTYSGDDEDTSYRKTDIDWESYHPSDGITRGKIAVADGYLHFTDEDLRQALMSDERFVVTCDNTDESGVSVVRKRK